MKYFIIEFIRVISIIKKRSLKNVDSENNIKVIIPSIPSIPKRFRNFFADFIWVDCSFKFKKMILF